MLICAQLIVTTSTPSAALWYMHTLVREQGAGWVVPAVHKLQGTSVPLGQVAGVCPGCHSTFYRLISVAGEAEAQQEQHCRSPLQQSTQAA